MSKTQKTVLIIAGAVLLILSMPFILIVGMVVAPIIEDFMITQKDVEEFGKEIQPKTEMVFPADTTFVHGVWVKYGIFQERGAGWKYTSKEPFQLPENVGVKIEKDNMDRYEKLFSGWFETNIAGATEYMEARWVTNGFVFSAKILKTPEQYYLNLGSWYPRSYELKAKETKEEI